MAAMEGGVKWEKQRELEGKGLKEGFQIKFLIVGGDQFFFPEI